MSDELDDMPVPPLTARPRLFAPIWIGVMLFIPWATVAMLANPWIWIAAIVISTAAAITVWSYGGEHIYRGRVDILRWRRAFDDWARKRLAEEEDSAS